MKKSLPICFMHIGKTGGNAISRELFSRFDPAKTLNASADQMEELTTEDLLDYDLIVGHWSWTHAKKLPKGHFLFSMVRHPVERVLSDYGFLRSSAETFTSHNPLLVELAKSHEIEDFIELDQPEVRWVVENHQTCFFAGDWRLPQGRSEPELIDKAIGHLGSFDLVGLHERYNESLQILCTMLDWAPWNSGYRYNVTPDPLTTADLDLSTVDRILELNKFDVALYDTVSDQFDRQFRDTLFDLVTQSWRGHGSTDGPAPKEARFCAADAIDGSGWLGCEYSDNSIYRWIGPQNRATLKLCVDRSNDLQITCLICRWVDREILESLTLDVDGHSCELVSCVIEPDETGQSQVTKSWHVPADPDIDGPLILTFRVSGSHSLGEAGFEDEFGLEASIAVVEIEARPFDALRPCDYESAEECIKTGIEILHSANGRPSIIVEAEKIFEQATARDPDDPNAWFWKAEACCYQGRATDGIPALETALKLVDGVGVASRPLDQELKPRVYERLGEAMIMADRLEEAKKYLERAVSLSRPKAPDLYRLNSATYMLDGLKKMSRKVSTRQRMSRWPIHLEAFSELEKLINYCTAGIEQDVLLTRHTHVVTLGSCFAKNVAEALITLGVEANALGLGELINSTFSNRALLEWVNGKSADWHEPQVIETLKVYFGESTAEVANRIRKADLIVLTLGVAPAFFDRKSGLFHLSCPNPNTLHLLKTKLFRATSVAENVENMRLVVENLRELNPKVDIILTVSPVPLHVSFGQSSAVLSDCVSKSTLRVTADEIVRTLPGLHYWPAFEVIRWLGAYHPGMYGADDGTSRHVSERPVQAIMKAFVRTYGDHELVERLARVSSKELK